MRRDADVRQKEQIGLVAGSCYGRQTNVTSNL
jgi:hypothetical protein